METVQQQSDSAPHSLALYCSNGTCSMRGGSHWALYAHYSPSVSSILSVLSVILQYHSDDDISNNSSAGSIVELPSMTFIMTLLLIDVVVSVFQDQGSLLDGLTLTAPSGQG